ncbi:mediator-associated protein 2 [Euphorbia lathyris]|uniref:mediator-associated protein 2 n=1 Tax=Euphorbia lathyris TaxID=212925 RepID=UPI0033144909
MVANEEGYKPEAGFQEDLREPLVDLSLTDSTELWLIQWPQNELPDCHGIELPLNLHGDGCLGSFEGLSGKAYDVVSCATREPNATVFLSTASETKIVGNISRRVSLVHYPDPKELERQEAEKKSKRFHQMSGGSTTPSRSSKLRNPSSSRSHAATHSSRKSSLSEVGERSSGQKRRKTKPTASTDRSTLDSGRGHIGE